MPNKIPIILDCDPGVDDAFALFYAMAEETFDIRLITTVSGNVSVDHTTDNAQHLVAMAGKDIKIAKGAKRPLVAEAFHATNVHGNNGMGDYIYKDNIKAPLSQEHALEAMVKVLEDSDIPVTIIAIGPLTNIALLFMNYPHLMGKIKVLSIMGGGLKGGNTTRAAEFNFLSDPEAAQMVFQSEVPIIMAGLDVTEQAYIDKTHLEQIRSSSHIGAFLAEVIVTARKQNPNHFRTSLHDVVSCMFLTQPELFEYETLNVVIETQGLYTRGMSVADRRLWRREEGNVKVLTHVKHRAFLDHLCKQLEYYND